MSGSGNDPRRRRRVLVAVLLCVIAVLFPARAASAHATLIDQTPKAGDLVQTAPETLQLVFSEEVSIALGGVRLFGPDGEEVDLAKPTRSDGGRVITTTFNDAGEGTYTVAWRVLSADAHPISSAYTFSVGKDTSGSGTPGRAAITDAFGGSGGDTAVGVSFGVARVVAFAGLTLLVGGFAFLWLVWPAGIRSRLARRLLLGAWAAAVVGTVAGILLQGPYAGGLALGDAFDLSLVGDVLGTRFGTVWAARLGLLVLALYWLATLERGRFRLAGAALGAMLLLTPGLSGHASTGQYAGPALVADLVHLAGVAVWLGGLAMLCAAVLPRRDEPLGDVVPRFSRLGFWAVVVIITSGVFQSWRQVRFADALTDTTYGRLLLVKLAAFLGMIGLAAVSRRVVHERLRLPAGGARRPRLAGPGAMLADADDHGRSQLRSSVLGEVIIAVVVLSVTAVLVNSVPGREVQASPKAKSYFATLESDTVDIEVSVGPGGVGNNQIHIYTLDKKGAAMGVAELTATLALPDQSLGPLPLELTEIFDGHWQADQHLAIPGTWELVFTVRLDEFNQERLTTRFVIP